MEEVGSAGGYVRRLDEIDSSGISIVGGKATNLGELARAGFPVPPAFVVDTTAYRRHIEASSFASTCQIALKCPTLFLTGSPLQMCSAISYNTPYRKSIE